MDKPWVVAEAIQSALQVRFCIYNFCSKFNLWFIFLRFNFAFVVVFLISTMQQC